MNGPSLQVFVYYTPGSLSPQSFVTGKHMTFEMIVRFLNIDYKYPVYVWSPLTGQWSRILSEPARKLQKGGFAGYYRPRGIIHNKPHND